jgi:hypothetical protein
MTEMILNYFTLPVIITAWIVGVFCVGRLLLEFAKPATKDEPKDPVRD